MKNTKLRTGLVSHEGKEAHRKQNDPAEEKRYDNRSD